MLKVKRKMDYMGLMVKTTREMANGWCTIAAGTWCEVTGWSAGLSLKSEPCECCKVQVQISKVQLDSVKIEQSEYNHKRLEWNEQRKRVRTPYGDRLQEPSDPMPTRNKRH